MKLRPYQEQAVQAIRETFASGNRAALLVMATGLGKTVVFTEVMRRCHAAGRGRSLLVAHRSELIEQAASTVQRLAGLETDVDMADRRAMHDGFRVAPVVCASVQTLAAGSGSRLRRMDPRKFGLVVLDEAHHAVADTWRDVVKHFREADGARTLILGATATPDRADESALGQVFDAVAFRYDIADAIVDGWLVPVKQSVVNVTGLDYSEVRTTAGDLNGRDLARVLEYEENLHRMMEPTMEIAGDRRTLVFAATVDQAKRLAEIANRRKPGCAASVDGKTPHDERAGLFRDFASGRIQYLVNVGIATEGWDDAATDGRGVSVIAMMRPTKSRALYTQMAGRGLRPLPRCVDGIEDAAERHAAIAASAKPSMLVLDYVGNCGRHRLCSAVDALGGRFGDEVRERAADDIRENGETVEIDVLEALDRTDVLVRDEAAAKLRKNVKVKAKYGTQNVDPFRWDAMARVIESRVGGSKPATDKQVAILRRNGVRDPERLTVQQASAVIHKIMEKPSPGQAALLSRYGLDPSNYDRRTASEAIDRAKRGLVVVSEN